MISLFFACLFSACQSLPTPREAITEVKTQRVTSGERAVARILPAKIPDQITLTSRNPAEAPGEVEESLPADVWQRLRNGYKIIPSQQAKVFAEIRSYKSHPTTINLIQERATPYIHFILEELEKRDMPAEIALLPAVESAFQPFAYSPGRAAGIWQFIPSTGRGFGLKQNWWYDGRRDVVASTRAALDYLKQLNQQFDGDWELALAAYNSGAGTVRSAIRKNSKKGEPTNFWSLTLPRETENYVPRLLAISEIFANPDEYNITLLDIPNKPFFTTVDTQSQLDLALAAQMAELSIQEIYQLNAGYNRWATNPDGPHQLHLPVDKAPGFIEKLSQLPDAKRVSWKRYKIKSGDSLSVIAKKHGTTSKLLQRINKLSDSKIRAGKHLLIPFSTKQLDHYALSAGQRKANIQNKHRKGSKQDYVVRKGDNLWKIAKTHKVSLKKLAKWNGMAPGDPLRPGQKLVVWVKKERSPEKLSALEIQPSGIQSSVSYKVRRGDSLSGIAQRFSVSVNELKKWNALPSKYLQPGQRLKLYVDVTEQTAL